MRDNVEAARDAGTNIASFSANTAYWQVRFEDAGPLARCASRRCRAGREPAGRGTRRRQRLRPRQHRRPRRPATTRSAPTARPGAATTSRGFATTTFRDAGRRAGRHGRAEQLPVGAYPGGRARGPRSSRPEPARERAVRRDVHRRRRHRVLPARGAGGQRQRRRVRRPPGLAPHLGRQPSGGDIGSQPRGLGVGRDPQGRASTPPSSAASRPGSSGWPRPFQRRPGQRARVPERRGSHLLRCPGARGPRSTP